MAIPANDNLANALALTGLSGTVTVDARSATVETGEPWPNPASPTFGRFFTTWYKITPSANGNITLDTLGSGSADDTVLGVWSGPIGAGFTDLVPVGFDHDSAWSGGGGPVTYGWDLTTSNIGLTGAGIDRTTLPTFSGSITAGMTISLQKITDCLDLSGTANVTLDRVWLAPTSGAGRQALILGPGTVINDSDIDGTTMQVAERDGIYGNSPGDYTIERVLITAMTVGAWLDGDGTGIGTMTDTYITNLVSNGGFHMDGLTRRSGMAALSLTRVRIDDSGATVTGAFFVQNTYANPIAGITVTDSMLEGDGFVLTLENNGPGTSVGFNNVRLRSTGWGPISGAGVINYTSWVDVLQYDGSRLPLADGAPIGHP